MAFVEKVKSIGWDRSPQWEQVENALELLDNHKCETVSLWGPDGAFLALGRVGVDGYYLTARSSDAEAEQAGLEPSSAIESVLEKPEAAVVGRELVLLALRAFFERGERAPELRWVSNRALMYRYV